MKFYGTDLKKEAVLEAVYNEDEESVFSRYKKFFVGCPEIIEFLKYEFIMSIAGPAPGALGLLLRKLLYPKLMGRVGSGVNFGRSITLRHPHKIEIGKDTAIDDYVTLDARELDSGVLRLGDSLLVARNVLMQSKSNRGSIEIGDGSVVGPYSLLTSVSGIRIGRHVGVAGQCYIGGARYQTNDLQTPIIKQPIYTEGAIEIADNCSIGAGVRILDGVKIGEGAFIGAGVVVREDIPAFAIVTPHQRLVMTRREASAA